MNRAALAACWVILAAVAGAQTPAPPVATLRQAVAELGSFEFGLRTEAAKTLRRAPSDVVAPLLLTAAREHKDEFVRFRALVLLSGFNDDRTSPFMSEALGDRNDRLRTVAGEWFTYHPDPAVIPALVAALAREESEFVRPALTRALAAHGGDERARAALTPLVMQGADLFRGAAIEALGDFKGLYALDTILRVAEQDGPLQDDAITALGKLGAKDARPRVAALLSVAPPQLQPTVSAALCLLGENCEGHKRFIREALEFAASHDDAQALLRGAVHALSLLASTGHDDALSTLLARVADAPESVREPIALGVGLVALRHPETLLRVLEGLADRSSAIDLVRDAFDMLAEDFEEERFYASVRRAYWAAADGSVAREIAMALIVRLEF